VGYGLTDGDVIDASFWVYDSTPQSEYPKGASGLTILLIQRILLPMQVVPVV